MTEALIRTDPVDIARRLMDHFGTTVEDWIAVAHHVVTARADSSPYDPASASGLFGYIYGTRATRSLLVPKGYVQIREDNVEATYSADRHLKVIYQNADWAADPLRYPRAISAKGPHRPGLSSEMGGYFRRWKKKSDGLKARHLENKPLAHGFIWFPLMETMYVQSFLFQTQL